MIANGGGLFGIYVTLGVFGLLAVLFTFIMIVAIGAAKKRREMWQSFAAANGLQFNGNGLRPALQGMFGGCMIDVQIVIHGTRKHRHSYTRFAAAINTPLPHGLCLYRESVFSGVGSFLGMQDIKTGDPAVDSLFVIKGNDENGARAVLGRPAVRNALVQVGGNEPRFSLANGWASYEIRGMPATPAELHAGLSRIAFVAAAFLQ
ncbi:MAG: hypothetical protein IT462_18010 [Planctomycetes bacterium]|nr:hypothetical protein [Planctomycetota bacterium]